GIVNSWCCGGAMTSIASQQEGIGLPAVPGATRCGQDRCAGRLAGRAAPGSPEIRAENGRCARISRRFGLSGPDLPVIMCDLHPGRREPVRRKKNAINDRDRDLAQVISLSLVLFVTWLLLSGIYDVPLLVGLGVVSVIAVVAISRRMGVIDHEGHPVHLGSRVLIYWPWLLTEIMKSNLDVARRILSSVPDISPVMVRVPTGLRSDLGRVVYANSITLTPGTVSVVVDPDTILVHALTRDGAAAVEAGDMERRVVAFVDETAR
ncbi:MAG: Na+/H+ antiporter subunit E, partial [Alphaproteobacteria bacterium]